jgi:hypothetical protein
MRMLLLPLLLLAACSPAAPEPAPGRVLVIGLDGATMQLARLMMKSGRLPNLSRLAREGSAGQLTSDYPLLSPRVWTTIATGKTPDKHGIEDWVYRDEQGHAHVYESLDRRGAALWNIASDAGLRVATVNWLMTYPPEVLNGVVVTDHALPREGDRRRSFGNRMAQAKFKRDLDSEGTKDSPVIFPLEWHDRLWPAVSTPAPFGEPDPCEPDESLKGVAIVPELAFFCSVDQRAAKIAMQLQQELDPDLLMVLLNGVDRISHSLWGTLRPETAAGLDEEKRQAGVRFLTNYYELADQLVGRLLEHYGPNDLVLVVSDHGFEWKPGKGIHPWGGTHESEKALHGIIFARGPGVPEGRTTPEISINDITPTILAWLGLPVAADMDGKPASFVQREIHEVASYDSIAIERIGETGSEAEPEILRQLEALGYIQEQ